MTLINGLYVKVMNREDRKRNAFCSWSKDFCIQPATYWVEGDCYCEDHMRKLVYKEEKSKENSV